MGIPVYTDTTVEYSSLSTDEVLRAHKPSCLPKVLCFCIK